MTERRDYPRFESGIRVTISSVEFVSNVTADAFLIDCSRTGAHMVSPIYFKAGQKMLIKIDVIGAPLQIAAKVLDCREDATQKIRFEKTYVLRVQFDELGDEDWNHLLMLGK